MVMQTRCHQHTPTHTHTLVQPHTQALNHHMFRKCHLIAVCVAWGPVTYLRIAHILCYHAQSRSCAPCSSCQRKEAKLSLSAASDVISSSDRSVGWTVLLPLPPPPLPPPPPPLLLLLLLPLVLCWASHRGGAGRTNLSLSGGGGGHDARKAWPCLKTLSQLAVWEDKKERSVKAADSGFMPPPPPTTAAGLGADQH